MQREISVYRWDDSLLVVGRRNVASDPWKPKFKEYRGNILVLELDRAFRPINIALEKAIVLSLAVGPTDGFVVEHREIVSDDEIKFLIGPIATLDRFFRHG